MTDPPPRVYLDANVFVAAFEHVGAHSDHAWWIIRAIESGEIAAGTRSLSEYSQIAEPRGIEFSSVFASIPAMESSTLDGGFLGIEFSSESMIANTRTGS